MDTFSLSFPIQKIDKNKRIVTGIATADNVDQEDDLIEFDASLEAFSNWIGNIREMHQPVAVGKIVDWSPVPVMHRSKVYNGIEVSVYISKGAQDTWEKILDQTLRGFSIGGRALEKERQWLEAEQKSVNVIKKYVLGELSVVDNPCNPAGMFTMIKSSPDGTLTYESMQKGEINNDILEDSNDIYYCFDHEYATIGDNPNCPVCAKEMIKIGEATNFNAEVVQKMLNSEKGGIREAMELHEKENNATITDTMESLSEAQQKSVLSKFGEILFGGADSATIATSSTSPNVTVNIDGSLLKGLNTTGTTDVLDVDTSDAEEIEEEDPIEKSVDVITEETDITPEASADETESDNKEEIDVNLDEVLEKFTSVLDAKLDEKLDAVKAEIQAEVAEKVEGIEKSVSDVTEKVTEQSEEIEKVANSGATKKSEVIEDDDEEIEVIEKSIKSESFWSGIFVPGEVANALGYES